MKRILLIAFIFLFIKVEAQNVVIGFSSTKSDEKIDSVLVENLSQGKSVVLKGTTNLELTASTVTSVPVYGIASQFKVYPNPVSDVCFIQFENNESGSVVVGLYDLTGKQIISQIRFLEQGVHEFQLSGLPSGISVIKIIGMGFNYTDKIISTGKGSTGLTLKYSGESSSEQNPKQLKGATTNVLMQYNTGERLKYTVFSNGNSTVQTDVPTQSKTVAATFVEAKDTDGNNYSTVTIGTQTWMLENLKTTKYNDGTAIPNVTDNSAWFNLVTPGYCWYNNDAAYKNPYGALYNWYTVNTGKLAPKGWRVPSQEDWTLLRNYLIANGYNYDGTTSGNKIAKALTSINSWKSERTVEGTPGSSDYPEKQNSTGFSALPCGSRQEEGFVAEGYLGLWLSSQSANCVAMTGNLCELAIGSNLNSYGLSVRCIKGEEPVANVQGNFTDGRDGKTYKTVTIGTQTWMAENLAYLPKISHSTEGSETEPYYYVYDYYGTDVGAAKATANFANYGVLYNWPAAKSACPMGWHLPNSIEWFNLINFLGGEFVAGGKLKETDTTHWYSPNTGATNETGFTALPGGYYFSNPGGFDSIKKSGFWWSSETTTAYANYFGMSYYISNGTIDSFYKKCGFSVRCVKD
jgi:uncharacterized protein (TIGR02145 family)